MHAIETWKVWDINEKHRIESKRTDKATKKQRRKISIQCTGDPIRQERPGKRKMNKLMSSVVVLTFSDSMSSWYSASKCRGRSVKMLLSVTVLP